MATKGNARAKAMAGCGQAALGPKITRSGQMLSPSMKHSRSLKLVKIARAQARGVNQFFSRQHPEDGAKTAIVSTWAFEQRNTSDDNARPAP